MKNKELPHLFYSGERVSKKNGRVSIGGMASSDFKHLIDLSSGLVEDGHVLRNPKPIRFSRS
jgi:hypothetical protein